jgi:hypothetical protein
MAFSKLPTAAGPDHIAAGMSMLQLQMHASLLSTTRLTVPTLPPKTPAMPCLQRLETRAATDPARFHLLFPIVEDELERNDHDHSRSCTKGLLWLKRWAPRAEQEALHSGSWYACGPSVPPSSTCCLLAALRAQHCSSFTLLHLHGAVSQHQHPMCMCMWAPVMRLPPFIIICGSGWC